MLTSAYRRVTRGASVAAALAAVAALTAACSQPGVRVQPRQAVPLWNASEATPAAAAPQEPAAGAVDEYRLGAGDVVKISVYNNPDLATEAELSRNGRISFPLIGEITIGGLSRSGAEKAIAASLGKGGFVPNAHVNLLVTQYRSQQVTVMGEVSKPGAYPIRGATGLTEVLAMAGGITSKGSGTVVVMQRDANGRAVQQELEIKRVLAGADGAGVQLRNDDVIYVPPMPVFYIYGEVRQPGSYPLAKGMTVRQALSVGGGLTLRGTERGVRVERRGPDGTMRTLRPALDERLLPDDVLQVPEGWF